jgi:7-cyano-7-deazaguanine synthase
MLSTVVPFRNGIMLSIAVGMAENRHLSHVMMANHGGDHAVYPDCRPSFVSAFSAAAQAGTYQGVTLEAPYTNLTKTEIARRGRELGIDYAETWSCYRGGEHHCGRCATCVERHEALTADGHEDPTIYE